MQRTWFFSLGIITLLLSSCELENTVAASNPYQTARIIMMLEEQQIKYRLGRNGKIYYSRDLENEVEAARKKALVSSASSKAVIVRQAQARFIAAQLSDVSISYTTIDFGHYVLLAWEIPVDPGEAAPVTSEQEADGSIRISFD